MIGATMRSLNRRQFVKQSMAATTLAMLNRSHGITANDKVIIGLMGAGGRGTALAGMFAARKDVEFAYVCDPDSRRFANARKVIEAAQGHPVQCVQDFRRMLEDKS